MRRYLMLHAMWHQCYCDLYRFMIPGLRDSLSEEAFKKTSPEYIAYCQEEAIKHAKALVCLFRMAQKVGDGVPQDPGINVFVYQCARIIIRAFDLGLLGSFPTGLEILSQLQDATKIMLPIIAVRKSTSQLVSATMTGFPVNASCLLTNGADFDTAVSSNSKDDFCRSSKSFGF